MEADPDSIVPGWIDAQVIETLYLSAVTVAELRYGIASMAGGRRRDTLHDRLEQEVLPLFEGRVLPFDLEAPGAFADLMARAKVAGSAIAAADGYIAATAVACGLIVATRDTSPFEAAGLKTINPWQL